MATAKKPTTTTRKVLKHYVVNARDDQYESAYVSAYSVEEARDEGVRSLRVEWGAEILDGDIVAVYELVKTYEIKQAEFSYTEVK